MVVVDRHECYRQEQCAWHAAHVLSLLGHGPRGTMALPFSFGLPAPTQTNGRCRAYLQLCSAGALRVAPGSLMGDGARTGGPLYAGGSNGARFSGIRRGPGPLLTRGGATGSTDGCADSTIKPGCSSSVAEDGSACGPGSTSQRSLAAAGMRGISGLLPELLLMPGPSAPSPAGAASGDTLASGSPHRMRGMRRALPALSPKDAMAHTLRHSVARMR